MLKWVPVVFGLALLACTFDSSSEAFSDDRADDLSAADAGQESLDDSDAGGNANPGADDAGTDIEPVGLYSDTAIVRYFIDDGAQQDEAAEIADAIGSPELPLALTDPEGVTDFVSTPSRRGIRFAEIADETRLSVGLRNTKIRDRLDGSRTGTIELVLDVEAVLIEGSRLSHIGDSVDPGRFSLRSSSSNSVDFYMNNVLTASWFFDLYGAGRMVLHLVVDTTQDSTVERVKLYLNGQEQVALPLLMPIKNQTISISNAQGSFYALGNREVGGRSLQGTFHYAAMYSGAMSADRVANNASLLQSSDDSAQITGQ